MDLPNLSRTEENLRHCLLLKADDLYFTLADPQGREMRDSFLGLSVEGLADENLSEEEISSIDLSRFQIARCVKLLHNMLNKSQLSLYDANRPNTEDGRNDALHFVEHFLSTLPSVALGGLDLTGARNREVRTVYELASAWLTLIETIEGAFCGDSSWMLSVSDVALLAGIDVRSLRNLCGPTGTIRTIALDEIRRTGSDAPVFVYLNGVDALNWLRSRKDFKIAPVDPVWITRSLAGVDPRNASRGLIISAIVNLGPMQLLAEAIGLTIEELRGGVDGTSELSPQSFDKLLHLLTVEPTQLKKEPNMIYTSNLPKQTAELHNLLTAHPRVEEHPKGHSKYVLRYQTDLGHEIAVEKRAKAPLLYFTRELADACLAGFELDYFPATKEGRNSNLNTLDTFRAKPLACLRVNELETARNAIEACVSS